jgi:hypothetical protein
VVQPPEAIVPSAVAALKKPRRLILDMLLIGQIPNLRNSRLSLLL